MGDTLAPSTASGLNFAAPFPQLASVDRKDAPCKILRGTPKSVPRIFFEEGMLLC